MLFSLLRCPRNRRVVPPSTSLTAVSAQPEVGLFVTFGEYPLGFIISIIAVVLICTFFITSANSGTFALSMLTSEGVQNPPKTKMLLWGIIQSITAVGMLLAGGLKPLQTMSIASAFPFIFVMIAVMFAIPIALSREKMGKPAEDSGEGASGDAVLPEAEAAS